MGKARRVKRGEWKVCCWCEEEGKSWDGGEWYGSERNCNSDESVSHSGWQSQRAGRRLTASFVGARVRLDSWGSRLRAGAMSSHGGEATGAGAGAGAAGRVGPARDEARRQSWPASRHAPGADHDTSVMPSQAQSRSSSPTGPPPSQRTRLLPARRHFVQLRTVQPLLLQGIFHTLQSHSPVPLSAPDSPRSLAPVDDERSYCLVHDAGTWAASDPSQNV